MQLCFPMPAVMAWEGHPNFPFLLGFHYYYFFTGTYLRARIIRGDTGLDSVHPPMWVFCVWQWSAQDASEEGIWTPSEQMNFLSV